MYKLYFLLFSIGAAAASLSTPVRKCKGTNQDLFERVVVSTPKGICTKLPCELISGTDVKADISFLIRSEVQKITLKCNATALGVTVEYPIRDADKGCDFLTNTYCPVEAGTEADLTFKMNVSKLFPKISADLTFYLLNQRKEMISCFEVLTRIVDSKSMLQTDITEH